MCCVITPEEVAGSSRPMTRFRPASESAKNHQEAQGDGPAKLGVERSVDRPVRVRD